MHKFRWTLGFLTLWVLAAGCGGSTAADTTGSSGTPGGTSNQPTPHVRTVTLDATTVSLVVGASRQVNATVAADSGFTGSFAVAWTSTNPAVASVTAGRIDAISAGSATVVARSVADSSISASVAVTVTAPPPPPPNACAPVGLTLGQTVQGSFDASCTIAGLGTARQYTLTLAKSTAIWASLSTAQSVAIGTDLDHAATEVPNAGTTAQVTYALLLPAGTPKFAIYGGGNFSLTTDTTTAGMLNAQNCVVVTTPGASASITLGRACVTVDVYFAWTATKQLTLTAQHPSITPSVQLLVNGQLLAIGVADDAAHRTSISLLPSNGQFIRVALNGANANNNNSVTVTVTQ